MKRLNEKFVGVKDIAKKLIQTGEEFTNVVFVVGMDYVEPIPFVFRDSKEKRILVAMILAFAKEENAIGIIMASDAWTTSRNADKAFDVNKEIPPSESPDRTEALIVACSSREFNKAIIIPYHRVDGKVVLEDEQQMDDFEDMNFASLFKNKLDS